MRPATRLYSSWHEVLQFSCQKDLLILLDFQMDINLIMRFQCHFGTMEEDFIVWFIIIDFFYSGGTNSLKPFPWTGPVSRYFILCFLKECPFFPHAGYIVLAKYTPRVEDKTSWTTRILIIVIKKSILYKLTLNLE